MAVIQKITPCLWFDREAEQATELYLGIFSNSRIIDLSRYGDGMPLPKGTALVVQFELEGQRFQALNGGPVYKFTEAISMSVRCETQAEVDHFWDKLSAGGQPGRCGWLKDKFGLSWQVIPKQMGALLQRPGVVQAMMTMSKIDLQKLQDAAKS